MPKKVHKLVFAPDGATHGWYKTSCDIPFRYDLRGTTEDLGVTCKRCLKRMKR